MIVVEIKLVSAVSPDRDRVLGTLLLDNVGGNLTKCDYRCRMIRKGAKWGSKPTREGVVKGHRREAEPVQNLVAKALHVLGYKHA